MYARVVNSYSNVILTWYKKNYKLVENKFWEKSQNYQHPLIEPAFISPLFFILY